MPAAITPPKQPMIAARDFLFTPFRIKSVITTANAQTMIDEIYMFFPDSIAGISTVKIAAHVKPSDIIALKPFRSKFKACLCPVGGTLLKQDECQPYDCN